MRVAIAGAGKVGRAIARELLSNYHQVLLIDREPASRWTVTVAAWRLTEAGSGPVLPLALRSR